MKVTKVTRTVHLSSSAAITPYFLFQFKRVSVLDMVEKFVGATLGALRWLFLELLILPLLLPLIALPGVSKPALAMLPRVNLFLLVPDKRGVMKNDGGVVRVLEGAV